MLDKKLRQCGPTLNIILFGDSAFNVEINDVISEAVQDYIIHTKWLDW